MNYQYTNYRYILIVLLIITGTCNYNKSNEAYTVFKGLVKTEDIGTLQFNETIIARDGGFSTIFNGESIWVFGDTILNRPGENGSAWRSSTWSSTLDFNAYDNIYPFDDNIDSLGAPFEFLPFNDEETAYNIKHNNYNCTENCSTRFALWPGPIIINPSTGSALILYTKIFVKPGDYNFISLGVSIANWKGMHANPEREKTNNDTGSQKLLFPKGEPPLSSSALIYNDHLYLYGCEVSYLTAPCVLAKAPVEKIFNRFAWRFYKGRNKWSSNHKMAKKILTGAPIMSVHWNNYLSKYIAIHNAIVSNTVLIHTSDKPEGPWSKGEKLFTGKTPENPKLWNYSAIAHREFSQQDGKVEYVTYFRPTGHGGEMRLVKIIFR